MVILAWTGDELSCRQAQNGETFDFEVKFDLEGQGQSPPKTIGILTKVFYSKFGDPSLNRWWVIAWTSKWLPHTRTDGWMDGHTDRRRQRQYPKAKTGLGLKEKKYDEEKIGLVPQSWDYIDLQGLLKCLYKHAPPNFHEILLFFFGS